MTFAKTDEKYQVLEASLRQDQFLLIHLNPTGSEVIVPEHLKTSPTLTLKISYQFQGLTTIDKDKITAELLFNSKLFECTVPLSAIWGCTTTAEKNFIWPESLSSNSYSNLASEMERIKKPKLAVNKNTACEKDQSSAKKPKAKKTAEVIKRPSLTRIK